MAQFPALPLFTDSWVADTKHLSRLERGTYHDLLVLMWRSPECRVPNDDTWLAKRLGMTSDEVLVELHPIIAEFCMSSGNCITQKRLAKEWGYCKKKSRKQSVSAKSRWDKEKDLCIGNARNNPVAMPPTLPFPTLKKEKKDAANAASLLEEAESSTPLNGHAPDEKTQFYARAKSLFGPSSGGLATKLLKAKDGSVALARAAIETASTKGESAREYIGAIIRSSGAPIEQHHDPRL